MEHILRNGLRLWIACGPNHEFRFDDGTVAPPCPEGDLINAELQGVDHIVNCQGKEITTMELRPTMSEEHYRRLVRASNNYDLVIVTWYVLEALRLMGARTVFPNAVCILFTDETRRNGDGPKVSRTDKWTY